MVSNHQKPNRKIDISIPKFECKSDRFDLLTATKVLVLPESGVSKHAVMFLQHFIIQSRAFRNATNAILKNGEELIQTTLMCIAVYSQRTHVEVFADIFVALNKKYPAELIAWLKVLEINEFPTTAVSAVEKDRFMKAIIRWAYIDIDTYQTKMFTNEVFFFLYFVHSEKVNKRLIQGLIREFSARCREVLIQIP